MIWVKKHIVLIAMIFSIIAISAQKETLTFKVSKPKSEARILTVDSVFMVKKNNPLVVEMTGKNTVFRVTALNGTVRRKPNNYFEVRFENTGETVIKVYEKKPDGTTRLGLTQAFKVVAPPLPDIFVCGVKSDSVIDKKHLIKVGELTAKLKNSRINPAVMSFDMILPTDNGNDTLHINGSKFPIQVKNKLYEIKEGQVLIFENIRVLMPNREIAIVQEILVFIAKTDQYSVGHRDETIRKEEE